MSFGSSVSVSRSVGGEPCASPFMHMWSLSQKEHGPEPQLLLSAGSSFSITEVALTTMTSGTGSSEMVLNGICGKEKMLQASIWPFFFFLRDLSYSSGG